MEGSIRVMKDLDIAIYRNNHRVGQRLKAPKVMSNDKTIPVDAEILEIHKYHCLVQDVNEPKYRWCVKWIDLMVLGVN